MLLQTNSYIVPKEKRTEHARLVKRFRDLMARLGCKDFQVYEQAGPNWSQERGGRFVQIMRFRDREHQQAVRDAEAADPSAQDLIRDFCELINFAYQHQRGYATTAFYVEMGATPSLPGPAAKQAASTSDLDLAAQAEQAGTNSTERNGPRRGRDADDLSDLTSTGPFRPGTGVTRAHAE